MASDDALKDMGRYLHQDIDYGAKNPADLARNVIALMSGAERTALRKYLATALDRLSPSELKGKLNRATTDWGFSSKGADEFLRAAFNQLGSGLVDHSQKMTVAARVTAERKAVGQRS
jgi:hypothetical protein